MKILKDSEYRTLLRAKNTLLKVKAIQEETILRQQAMISSIIKTSKDSSLKYEHRIKELEEENDRMKRLISDLPGNYQVNGPFYGIIDGNWE